MTNDERELLRATRTKIESAFRLVESSVGRTSSYDSDADYTPEELEPFDALSDRFMRAVETCIRFFRSYERFVEGVQSETFRDTLHTVRKVDLISTRISGAGSTVNSRASFDVWRRSNPSPPDPIANQGHPGIRQISSPSRSPARRSFRSRRS
jgi:hypothetical protein